jgi:hypothetical protein
MARIIRKGYNGNTLQLQPGWTIDSDGYGLLTSRLTFRCDKSAVGKAPKKGDPHPEDGRLSCFKSTWTVDSSEWATITSEYIGIESGSFTRFIPSGQVALGSEPIETHPNFYNTPQPTFGSSPKPLSELGWDTGLQAFAVDDTTAKDNWLVGIKSYLAPSIQYSGTYYCNNISGVTDTMKVVGKTFAKFVGIEDFPDVQLGKSVSKNHDRFAFMTGANFEQFGNIWKINITFRISPGGWHSFIYGKHN